MVQREEPLEDVGVLLGRLHLVQCLQLPTQQHLVAAGHVDEHLRDARPQRGLLLGDPHSDVVDRVERLGQAADLVRGLDLDRLDGHARSFTRRLHALDHAGQLVADLTGGDRQAAQRPGDPACQGDREDGGEAQTDGGEADQEQRPVVLGPLDVPGLVLDVRQQALLRSVHRVDAGVRGTDPADGASVVRLRPDDELRDVPADGVHLGIGRSGQGLVQGAVDRLGRLRLELLHAPPLHRDERGSGGEVTLVDAAGQQRHLDQVALVGGVLHHRGQRLEGLEALAQDGVAGVGGDDAGQVEVLADDLLVGDVGFRGEEPAQVDGLSRVAEVLLLDQGAVHRVGHGAGQPGAFELDVHALELADALVGELPLPLHVALGAAVGRLEVRQSGGALLLDAADDQTQLGGDLGQLGDLAGPVGSRDLAGDENAGHQHQQQRGNGEDGKELGAHSSVTQHGDPPPTSSLPAASREQDVASATASGSLRTCLLFGVGSGGRS